MNLNKVFILGRVTADPQPRTTPAGQTVLALGVATNRTWTDKNKQKQEEVEFHNVVLFGRQAEVAAQYLKRGSLVLFEGRNRTRSWTDKDGNEHRITEVICENMQLGPAPAKEAPAAPTAQTRAKPPSLDEDGEDNGRNLEQIVGDEEIKPEDIPF